MKDGEATVSAGKTAVFPARAGALTGLLVATGLLSLPLQAAFDPPDMPSAAGLPVIDRNFAGVVAVGDDDVLQAAEARLVRVSEGPPKEPNPPARAAEGLGAAPEPWPARDLGLMERVQDWLARANREFQTVIVRRLSVAPPGGGGDDIAKKLEQVKDEDVEAAQAKQAAEAQRRQEAADALKLAKDKRKERERLAADSKRATEARLAAQAQQEAAKKAAAEDQKRRREEEHQRALADAASKAAEDAKRAEAAAERQAKLAAAEAQRRAEQEAAQAAAAKEAEEKAREAAAREAERERIAREDAEKVAQANAARAKAAEERAKQEAAAKEAADRQRAAEEAARAASLKAAEEKAKAAAASPAAVAKDGASVAFELHEARTVREARNTRLARGPVVKPWMRRVRQARQARCENAGRRISLPGHYVVARGDTLWQIALRHYRSGLYFMRIYRANRDVIRSPNVIYACERLYLPRR